jgi:hypothetical protein
MMTNITKTYVALYIQVNIYNQYAPCSGCIVNRFVDEQITETVKADMWSAVNGRANAGFYRITSLKRQNSVQ